ncbi:MAG: phosphonate metabolism protein PhnM [Clostridia bacterium]|nr:phosphonate metabolism protein PhnM [Clostridia bacterium]
MRVNRTLICNANIILPDKVLRGCILIEGRKISKVMPGISPKHHCQGEVKVIDADGGYVMPGLIDIHSDAIEKEIQPRPNTLFPVNMAFFELEKKLAASGITTMYHSLSLSDDWGVRNDAMVVDIIHSIQRLKQERFMVHHKVHLRYEITFLHGLKTLEKLIESKSIDFMSYMDHTPGQGQFKDPEALKEFTMKSYGAKEKEVEALFNKSKECQAMIDWPGLIELAKQARANGIRLASHDDDTNEKIHTLLECEGTVSEFPINLETARYAKSKGLHVCVGSPNVVRGKSHSNNMRAMDAIKNDAADIICSDYLPASMLPAVFSLPKEGLELYEAVRMVTLNPAKALGIDKETGSVENGKMADLLIVELYEGYPIVRKTMVGGKIVYQSDFTILKKEGVENVC